MSRQRPDTLNNREPAPPPTTPSTDEGPSEQTVDDDRIVFSSWDGALVPPLTRRD